MILLVGPVTDPTMAYVCARLLAKDAHFLLLDARLYPDQFDVTWSIQGRHMEGWLSYGAQRIALRAIRSVYVRYIGLAALSRRALLSQQESDLRQAEFLQTLVSFLDTMPALVMNRPAAALSNQSKPYQQQLIASHGFRTPKTIITTVPEEARRFYDECDGRVVYKSISSQRSIVQRLTPDDFPRLEQVRFCPTQFQEYLPGVELRVHTVGTRLFATEILSDAIDYRYVEHQGSTRTMRAVDLPPNVAERCFRLAQGLGLVLSGIDLRRSPDGHYYCLEVNPSPSFSFYQGRTGQQIGDAVIDLLSQGTTAARFI